MQTKNNKGFTLLEILLVIAAIGILASIVIVAINPLRQIGKAENAARLSGINTLQQALEQYNIDKGGYPNNLEEYYKEVCVGGNTTNCVDLSVLVTEGYIAEIPEDPKGGGYKVGISSNNRVSVLAEQAVLGESIVLNQLVPEWDTEAFEGENYLAKISTYFAPPRIFDPTEINLLDNLSGGAKWAGGVLAPNGNIYGIPRNSSQVLEIDISSPTPTINLFGDLGIDDAKWAGGVLAPNGKIYGIPIHKSQILEIDPETKEINTFGDAGSDLSKWYGGVLAPNGKIYGIPRNSTQVLEIDPETKTISLFGSLPIGASKWTGGVLAPNGKIYGIPGGATEVLEIDPENRTTSSFGTLSVGDLKWFGGVLAPNGKIYGIPRNSDQVLEIDPENRTVSLFGNLGTSLNKWGRGVLGPNGKIYGMPNSSTEVLEIDPDTRTTSLSGGMPVGNGKWGGAVLAPNGKVYGIPYASSQVLELGLPQPLDKNYLLNKYMNKH